jgi:alpha-galactosidase
LTFTRANGVLSGSMRRGTDEIPLFDVKETGTDVSFTAVIPGTPYVSVHYIGVHMGDEIRFVGSGDNQAAYALTARRMVATAEPNDTALAAPAPMAQPAPRVASLAPPPRPSPSTNLPPPSAQPTPAPAAGPPPKLPLPPLRDVGAGTGFKTPPMGWATREKLGTDMEDDDIRQAAEALEETKLRDIGYSYIEVDDGWQGMRDAGGMLHAGAKFPDMKALVAYVHSKQLKFGLQLSAAPKSCGGFEGSYGHEAEDAKLLASWGVDYVVYDWCGADAIYPTQSEQQAAYQKMGEALRNSGRDIALVMSQNGAFDVARWGSKTGAALWRTGPDIKDNWSSVAEAGFAANGKEGFAGAGHWNDPGLLQTGNGGMTPDEYRTQLNLWALIAAPMMLGNDVRIMTRDTLAMLSNREVAAIDQDPLARPGKRIAQYGQVEVWARPLADGAMAVGFFNRGNDSAPVGVSWEQLGIEGPRKVRDVWRHQDAGSANGRYVVFISGHTSLLIRLSR